LKLSATVSAENNEEVLIRGFEDWTELSTFNTLETFKHKFKESSTPKDLGRNFHPLTGGALLTKGGSSKTPNAEVLITPEFPCGVGQA
jgi:hypothetical protein